jgi:proline iminopeptidase
MKRFLTHIALVAALAGCHAEQARPGEGYAVVPGGRVWFRVVGQGPGTPLVVLHGGPGAPSYYLESLARLGAERPVVFYDQLGAGRSDQPSDTTLWRIERFMAELDSLRSHLGLRQIHLLGHSWGGSLAIDYLLAKPAGVRSVILASPLVSTARWLADADTLIATLPDSVRKVIAINESAGTYLAPAYQATVEVYYGRFLTRRGGPEADNTLADLNVPLYNYMWGPSEFTATGTLRSYDRTSRLRELDLPVLYTAGEFDEARPATVEYFCSLTPGARFALIPGSAHMTSVDAPAAFADTVSRFLRSVEAP